MMAEWLSLARRTLSESETEKINKSFFHAERRGFFLSKMAGVPHVLKHSTPVKFNFNFTINLMYLPIKIS
jgi:hypothetical protein